MKLRPQCTVLVADDEPLARRRLRDWLRGIDWVGAVLEAADGREAIRLIDTERPEIVFLDIRMPGANGLEVVQRMRHRPNVVFTTAYDRHAVTAFELQAIDYLLKPFGAERFFEALARARPAHTSAGPPSAEPEDPHLADRLSAGDGDRPLKRIFVRRGGRIFSVGVDDVERFEANGDYVRMVTSERDYLLSVRLMDLEARLDPSDFLRIHRSHLVNLRHVSRFEPHPGSRFLVHLTGGAQLVASRDRSREIRRRAL